MAVEASKLADRLFDSSYDKSFKYTIAKRLKDIAVDSEFEADAKQGLKDLVSELEDTDHHHCSKHRKDVERDLVARRVGQPSIAQVKDTDGDECVITYQGDHVYSTTPSVSYDGNARRWYGFIEAVYITACGNKQKLSKKDIERYVWSRTDVVKPDTEYDIDALVSRIVLATMADKARSAKPSIWSDERGSVQLSKPQVVFKEYEVKREMTHHYAGSTWRRHSVFCVSIESNAKKVTANIKGRRGNDTHIGIELKKQGNTYTACVPHTQIIEYSDGYWYVFTLRVFEFDEDDNRNYTDYKTRVKKYAEFVKMPEPAKPSVWADERGSVRLSGDDEECDLFKRFFPDPRRTRKPSIWSDERGSVQLSKQAQQPINQYGTSPADKLKGVEGVLRVAERYTDEKSWMANDLEATQARNRVAHQSIETAVESVVEIRDGLIKDHSGDHSTEINVAIEHLQQAYNYLWPERNAPHHRSFEERIARSMERIGFAINGLNEIKKKGASNG